jgi:hypothetical protein
MIALTGLPLKSFLALMSGRDMFGMPPHPANVRAAKITKFR